MTSTLEQQKEDNFVQQIKAWSYAGFITLGLSLARDTGVLQAMEKLGRPASAAEIAFMADCKSRYVQELLEQLVAAGVVHLDKNSDEVQHHMFFVPIHFWKGLKSTYMRDTSLVGALCEPRSKLIECFQKQGPLGLSPADVTSVSGWCSTSKTTIWDSILSVAFANDRDLQDKLEKGARVADIGCNVGKFMLILASRYPKSEFVGLDNNPVPISKAEAESKDKELPNLKYVVLNAEHLPADWSDSFDLVTAIDVIHDLPHATKVCQEIVRVLKPGGTTMFVDPKADASLEERVGDYTCQLYYASSLHYCMALSLSDPDSEGLSACMGQAALCKLFQRVGLKVIEVDTIPPGYSAYIGCTKP